VTGERGVGSKDLESGERGFLILIFLIPIIVARETYYYG
jgi:hypothetical protein